MLDRQKGDIVFECDGCGEVLETGTGDFDAARNLMRREQWSSVRVGVTWQNFCPQCSKSEVRR